MSEQANPQLNNPETESQTALHDAMGQAEALVDLARIGAAAQGHTVLGEGVAVSHSAPESTKLGERYAQHNVSAEVTATRSKAARPGWEGRRYSAKTSQLQPIGGEPSPVITHQAHAASEHADGISRYRGYRGEQGSRMAAAIIKAAVKRTEPAVTAQAQESIAAITAAQAKLEDRLGREK